MVPDPIEYPVQLGIAYLFLVGYLVRTLFVSMRLPASVGVIMSGFAFSYFFQTDIFFARDLLQELAFFLVLLTAGLEIRLGDLKPYIFVMAWLPATCELLAIAAYGKLLLRYTLVESLVLGTVLVAIGDGLVIPKMKEFGVRFKGHPLPRLVFTWAPLEASFALTLFGVLVGLSAPADQPSINIGLTVLANVLRIVATLVTGALLGAASGWLIPRRTLVTVGGRKVFTGAAVEAFLMVLASALIAFGIGADRGGKEMVPMGFCPGSLFQPELLVIVTGTFFAAVADQEVVHDVEGIMGGVWVFGQLILFSMLGSRTTPSIFPEIVHVLPIIASGLLFRFTGVVLAILITLGCCEGHPFRASMLVPDALFCFLSTVPRATIQGALGSVPVHQRFFHGYPHKRDAQTTIFIAARLYIVCMSVVGMVLLNTIGPRLCEATEKRPHWDELEASDRSGPQEAEDDGIEDPETSPLGHGYAPERSEIDFASSVDNAVELLAEEYSVSPDLLVSLLKRASAEWRAPQGTSLLEPDQALAEAEEEGLDESSLMRMVSEPTWPVPRPLSPLPVPRTWQHGAELRHGQHRRLLGIHAIKRRLSVHDLALAQFEAMGPLMVDDSGRSERSWRSDGEAGWRGRSRASTVNV